MPRSRGLARNIVQCLRDYDIPLLLSHTVTDIRGRERVEGTDGADEHGPAVHVPGVPEGSGTGLVEGCLPRLLGDTVLLADVCGTGAAIVATREL